MRKLALLALIVVVAGALTQEAPMSEWVGTVWFLMAIYWSSIRLQHIIDPWPKWTLLLAIPAHQVVIWGFAGVVAWMYQ